MAVQGTVNQTSPNVSVGKFIKFALTLILLVFFGLLIGFGVSSLLQKPDTAIVTSKAIVVDNANSFAQQAKTYTSSGSIDGSGLIVRQGSSSTDSGKLIHALGTLDSWNGNTLTLLTDHGEIEISESPNGVYELNSKTSVSVDDSDYLTSSKSKAYYEGKSVTIGLTESGNKVYAKYIAVVEGGF